MNRHKDNLNSSQFGLHIFLSISACQQLTTENHNVIWSFLFDETGLNVRDRVLQAPSQSQGKHAAKPILWQLACTQVSQHIHVIHAEQDDI